MLGYLGAELQPSGQFALAPGKEEEHKQWLSAEAAKAKLKATKQWFSEPAWSNGPPRWQVGTAGGIVAVGLTAIIWAAVGGKKR